MQKKSYHFPTIVSSLAATSRYLSITAPPYNEKHLPPTLRFFDLTPNRRRLALLLNTIFYYTHHTESETVTH